MIRYVVLDFDGTIADSKEVFLTVMDQFVEKHHLRKIEREEIDRLIQLPIPERLRYLKLPLYKIPLMAPEFYHLYKQNLDKISLMDGMRELLSGLKNKGYELAIISSNSEINIRQFIKDKQIEEYFKDIFCSSNIFGKHKMIKSFLKQYKLDASDIIYVGDEHRDVAACKKCGVKVIWVSWGYDDINLAKKENPDFIVYQPEEILNIL